MCNENNEIQAAFDEIGIGGIYDVFDPNNPADAIHQLGLFIREAEEELPGGFMPDEDSPYYGLSLADRIRSLKNRIQELEKVVDLAENAAAYTQGTVGPGADIKIDGRSGFNHAIHSGRRGSVINYMEELRRRSRNALNNNTKETP